MWLKLMAATGKNAHCDSHLAANEPAAPYRANAAAPLGHIPVEGRDWKVQIPFYSDAHTSALARDAALAVINSFDGAANTPRSASLIPAISAASSGGITAWGMGAEPTWGESPIAKG